ncbi:MAG: hypothetical protein KF764_28065 [Labilithrix sp.]|nr:hypothetical protein [Labilithrix sp.]
MLLVVACDDDGGAADSSTAAGDDDGGSEASPAADARVTRSPDGGRPASVACGADPRPPGNVDAAVDGGECAADDDCDAEADAGTEARCRIRHLRGTFRGPVCTYHACTTDQDCPGTTSVCGCGVGWAGQNLCLTNSNCRVDADCPTGQRCAFSEPPIFREDDTVHRGDEIGLPHYYGDAIGWFCTTPEDDCACPKYRISTDKCIYNLFTKHWDCGYTY